MASPKQLAMAWINTMLSPERIKPNADHFQQLFGVKLSDKKAEEAIKFVQEDLAKVRDRYTKYVTKYAPELSNAIPEEDDTNAGNS